MNASLIGNARAIAAVQRALSGTSAPHAWLFVGPEGVGKATLARWMAQALNCERNVSTRGGVGAQQQAAGPSATDSDISAMSPGSGVGPVAAPLQASAVEPCGECAQCDRIARGIHADVSTVTILPPEDGTQHKDISVDQVREVERAVALAPFEGQTRVIIIDPADDLSIGAQNAFLKTLEEPPPHTAFVLVTTGEELLLPTVRSRCRRIEFTLVPAAEIEGALLAQSGSEDADLHIDEGRARLLARLAGGRPGWALAMAASPALIEKRREMLEQAAALGGLPMADLMELSERLTEQWRRDREAVLRRLGEWLGWWRDLVLVQSGAADGIANADMLDGLREAGERYDPADVVAFVQALVECRRRLEDNVQARIALDALMVTAPRAASRAR